MIPALVILEKELTEIRRSPVMLVSLASLPATMSIVPVVLLGWLVRVLPSTAVEMLRETWNLPATGGPMGVLVTALSRQWLPLFLVMPAFLPILVAAQSVGGEKERRTLEPLLATPVSTLQIVLGKSLSALVPALLITWTSAAVLCAGVDLVASPLLHLPMPDASWVFGLLVVAPLLALFGNALAVAISARVDDSRAAQNLAAMCVVPLLGVMVAQIVGKIALGTPFYVGLSVALALADVALLALAVRLFDRERLLSRWR